MTPPPIWQIPLAASLLFVVMAVLYFRVLAPFLNWWWLNIKSKVFVSVAHALILSPFAAIAALLALMAWLYDIAYNVTFGALMFWQCPIMQSKFNFKWWITFSDRLQYIVENVRLRQTWRGRLALPIARFVNLIEPNHIRGF